MVPACKISAKSVQPFQSYGGHRHTDRQTHKHFKNITSLAEVIKVNLEGTNIDPLAAGTAGGAGGLYTYTLKVIMPKITKKSEIRSESVCPWPESDPHAKFQPNPSSRFRAMLVTDRQTDTQTDKSVENITSLAEVINNAHWVLS